MLSILLGRKFLQLFSLKLFEKLLLSFLPEFRNDVQNNIEALIKADNKALRYKVFFDKPYQNDKSDITIIKTLL